MVVFLHIGPLPGTDAAIRGAATRWPAGLGKRGHARLALAALDADHLDPLRAARGLIPEDRHAAFAGRTRDALTAALTNGADLFAADLAGRVLSRPSEIARLSGMFGTTPVRIVAHLPPLEEALARHWEHQLLWGRVTPLDRDLAVLAGITLPGLPPDDPDLHHYAALESLPPWADRPRFEALWRGAFADMVLAEDAGTAMTALGLDATPVLPAPRSAATLARARLLNAALRPLLAHGLTLTRRDRAAMMAAIAVPGPPLAPDAVARALADPSGPPLLPEPQDFDPGQVIARWATKLVARTKAADPGSGHAPPAGAAPAPGSSLPEEARPLYARLTHSRYAPHNRGAPAPSGDAAFPDVAPAGGRTLVACIKDEGPYLLEWLAFHRAVGFDRFVVYSNDCRDGSDAMLDRLARQGWLTHIDNSDWRGASPQQAALNHAITLPELREAEWVLHADLDEFVNIRCGDGTLDVLFARAPEATHWALTWRLFGAGGVTGIADTPVIGQFLRCAPAHCPKPHTAWGFKTLGRQIGVYGKLSCHRPTKPDPDRLARAIWVNGAGRPMGPDVARRGWRSNRQTVGYDLVQLNHYALRSRDAFLVKRDRGRALHVDREIGRNYWVRMDWADHEDRSILRHLPRTEAGIARLKSDPELARLHVAAVAWHRERAARLKTTPEAQALLAEIDRLRLTQTERAAYAMMLDHET